MELQTSLDKPLQGQIVCACLDTERGRGERGERREERGERREERGERREERGERREERGESCQWHFNTFLLAASMKFTTAQNTILDRPSPGLPKTALLDLIFCRQWKIS